MSDQIDIPVRAIRETLAGLERAGIVVKCALGDEEESYLPGRPVAEISVSDVLRAVRGPRLGGAGPTRTVDDDSAQADAVVERVLDDLDRATSRGGGAQSLADLLGTSLSQPGSSGLELAGQESLP